MNADQQDAVQAREEHYQDVSLRAVELLAKAQRAADEAVAEAQSYARDLEHSAREQYQQILQRAQAAAEQLASPEANGVGQESGTLDGQKLAYVRTYARVAHAQLKSVLAALTEELDQLAVMAEGNPGTAKGPGPVDRSTMPERAVGPQTPVARQGPAGLPAIGDALQRPSDHDELGPRADDALEETRLTDAGNWPPIFAGTNGIAYFHEGSWSDRPRF